MRGRSFPTVRAGAVVVCLAWMIACGHTGASEDGALLRSYQPLAASTDSMQAKPVAPIVVRRAPAVAPETEQASVPSAPLTPIPKSQPAPVAELAVPARSPQPRASTELTPSSYLAAQEANGFAGSAPVDPEPTQRPPSAARPLPVAAAVTLPPRPEPPADRASRQPIAALGSPSRSAVVPATVTVPSAPAASAQPTPSDRHEDGELNLAAVAASIAFAQEAPAAPAVEKRRGARYGQLTVRVRGTRPGKCRVELGGEKVGKTPLERHRVKVGTHGLVVRCPDGRVSAKVVEIEDQSVESLLLQRKDFKSRSRKRRR